MEVPEEQSPKEARETTEAAVVINHPVVTEDRGDPGPKQSNQNQRRAEPKNQGSSNNLSQLELKNRSSRSNRSREEMKSQSSSNIQTRHRSTLWSQFFWKYWTKSEASDCGFEVQGTFPRAFHVLSGYSPKGK